MFFTPSSANRPILFRLLALLRGDLPLDVPLQLAEILLQAVHHTAAILRLHAVKRLSHAAHIGLWGVYPKIAAEHIADALGIHCAALTGVIGIAPPVMDPGVDDLTGQRRKGLAVTQTSGDNNALRLRVIESVLVHGVVGHNGNTHTVQQAAQCGIHLRCVVPERHRRDNRLSMSLRDIKDTPDLVAVILPPVLDIGIRDTDLQAGLLPVYAASEPPPTLQAVDVGDVRVLRHRQHDIGGAVLRVDRLRIQIVQVGVKIPILDWGKRRGKVRVAKSNRDVVLSKIRQEEINFNQDIFLLVEHFNNQAQQLSIAKEADAIAQQRYKTSIETFLIGKINTLDLNDAQNSKDAARQKHISELYYYWYYFYQIRSLTLWDFRTNTELEADFDEIIRQ